MKKFLLNYGLSFMALVAFTATAVYAEGASYDDAKYMSRSFSVGSSPSLEVSNKYGNIDIQTWTKDSIRFDVEIKVSSNHLDKLNSMFDNVQVMFRNSSSYVAAETTFGNSGMLVATAMDLKKMLGSADRVEVNYKIMIPLGTDLEVVNKFGDVFLPKELNEVELDVSHGSIRGKNIYNVKNISLKYGKLRLDNIDRGNLDLKFSDASIQKAGRLTIESGSSHIDIEEVESLTINSRHDRMNIEKVESLNINCSLTDLDIDKLTREITGDLRFGSLKVDEVTTGFSGIKLGGSNTDVLVRFNTGIGFTYNVWLENGNSFRAPSNTLKNPTSQQNESSYIYNGQFGKAGTGIKVTINLKNSYVGFELND